MNRVQPEKEYFNMDEPWQHAKINKPDGKAQILHDFTYIGYLE